MLSSSSSSCGGSSLPVNSTGQNLSAYATSASVTAEAATRAAADAALQTELDAEEAARAAADAAHVAAADPHTQYQKESEKGAANGYASLDVSGTIPDAQIPSTIARDSEVTQAVTDHVAAADPHTQYQKESEKGAANGYASLDADTKVPAAQLGHAMLSGIGAPSSRTVADNTSYTPSATRPTFVLLTIDLNTTTAGANGPVNLYVNGVDLGVVLRFQNPLAAGTWDDERSFGFLVPANQAYKVDWNISGVGTVVSARALEWTL